MMSEVCAGQVLSVQSSHFAGQIEQDGDEGKLAAFDFALQVMFEMASFKMGLQLGAQSL